MNNIGDKSERYCTGCGACVCICPVGAISYKINENGFYQAFVDSNKCVKCGKIIHLECHFMEEISHHIEESHGFTLQCKNSILYGVCKECKGSGEDC